MISCNNLSAAFSLQSVSEGQGESKGVSALPHHTHLPSLLSFILGPCSVKGASSTCDAVLSRPSEDSRVNFRLASLMASSLPQTQWEDAGPAHTQTTTPQRYNQPHGPHPSDAPGGSATQTTAPPVIQPGPRPTPFRRPRRLRHG